MATTIPKPRSMPTGQRNVIRANDSPSLWNCTYSPEFAGLHIDPMMIGAINATKQGPEIKRKNNCIVNTGNKLSREEIKRRIQQNKELYELPVEEWRTITLPKREDPLVTLETKRRELREAQEELTRVLQEMDEIYARIEQNKENEKPATTDTIINPGKYTEAALSTIQHTKRVRLA
ncbi:hypothetical protein BDF22DRAFT_732677 [Syncephalis plumigaleata]|nr:hypothetical protein BDF22DRAFT_732677 [Syncephalis plumigaleata]